MYHEVERLSFLSLFLSSKMVIMLVIIKLFSVKDFDQ